MVKNIEKNRNENGIITNGATNGAQINNNNNYAEALRERKQMAIDGAASAAMNVEQIFDVQWRTLAAKINRERREKTPGHGCLAHGTYRNYRVGDFFHVDVFVEYERTADEYGDVTCDFTLRATCYYSNSALAVSSPLTFCTTTKNEVKFCEKLGSVMIRAIAAAWNDEKYVEIITHELRENDEREAKSAAYWGEKYAAAEECTRELLDKCGYNALELALALVTATKECDVRAYGTMSADSNEPWRACRDEILRRLASLGDGGGNPAPGCENAAEKSAEINGNPAPGCDDDGGNSTDNSGNPAPGFDGDGGNSNDNSGNPAPGLDDEYPNAGDVYATQTDGVTVLVTGGYFDEYGDWVVTGKLLGKNGPERDLYEVGGMLYYTDDNGFSYRLKRRVDEKKTDSGNYADAGSIAKLLAADYYEKIYGDCDDLGSYTLGDYILTTTRNEGMASVWMTATLMLTNEAQKKYVLDAHEQWELTWDVEYDDEIDETAQKIADAMITAPRHFFREGAEYMGDNGKTYTLDSAEWDGYSDRYSVTLTDADGEEIDAVMDAAATVVTFHDGDDNVVFHADDIVF